MERKSFYKIISYSRGFVKVKAIDFTGEVPKSNREVFAKKGQGTSLFSFLGAGKSDVSFHKNRKRNMIDPTSFLLEKRT